MPWWKKTRWKSGGLGKPLTSWILIYFRTRLGESADVIVFLDSRLGGCKDNSRFRSIYIFSQLLVRVGIVPMVGPNVLPLSNEFSSYNTAYTQHLYIYNFPNSKWNNETSRSSFHNGTISVGTESEERFLPCSACVGGIALDRWGTCEAVGIQQTLNASCPMLLDLGHPTCSTFWGDIQTYLIVFVSFTGDTKNINHKHTYWCTYIAIVIMIHNA